MLKQLAKKLSLKLIDKQLENYKKSSKEEANLSFQIYDKVDAISIYYMIHTERLMKYCNKFDELHNKNLDKYLKLSLDIAKLNEKSKKTYFEKLNSIHEHYYKIIKKYIKIVQNRINNEDFIKCFAGKNKDIINQFILKINAIYCINNNTAEFLNEVQ